MPANMKKKYGMGGPKTSNYVGNPMGYFNDKAMYGKEQMMKAQDGKLMSKMQSGGTTGEGGASSPSKPAAKKRIDAMKKYAKDNSRI